MEPTGWLSAAVSLVLILVIPVTLPDAEAIARTWHVTKTGTGDFASVQAGINAAAAGDTVLVGPGTYHEYIQFQGRDICVRSSTGPEMTVLDATGFDRSVVTIMMGEGRTAILEGFTLTGGTGGNRPSPFQGNHYGGGVFILDSEPTIRRNRIAGNRVIGPVNAGFGGGIFCYAFSSGPPKYPLIEENVIEENLAAGNGGGIGAWTHAAPRVSRNTIRANTVTFGDGGGVWLLLRVNGAEIEANEIHGNVVGDHGGGIYAASASSISGISLEVSGNVITDNVAGGRARTGDSGGGVWLYLTSAVVVGNTIVSNRGEGPGNAYGGNIVLQQVGSPRLERNIIALAQAGGGVLCRDQVTPSFSNNLTWGNDGGDGLGTCPEWFSGSGNLQADPLFCGAQGGDFSLPPNSPALTHPSGPLGATPEAGCSAGVLVVPTTWSRIKARVWN